MNNRIKMTTEAPQTPSAVATDAELEAALRALEDLPHNVDTEIGNLPGSNFIVTQEILMNNVCRLCATYYETGPNLVPLYNRDDNSTKRTLAEIASDFLPVRLQPGDGLPEVACALCEQELRTWRRMYNSCANAQKILFSQAERTSRIHFYSRNDNPTLNFVDLMDSSDSESEHEARTARETEPAPAPAHDPSLEILLLGSWAR